MHSSSSLRVIASAIVHIRHLNYPSVQEYSTLHFHSWHKHSQQFGPPAKQQLYSVALMEIRVFLIKRAQNIHTDISIYVQIYRTALVCDYIHSMNNGNHNRAALGKYTPLWSLQQVCIHAPEAWGRNTSCCLTVSECHMHACTHAQTHNK